MGPLSAIKVLEIAGLGPAPMACTLLADLGAPVLRVGRLDPAGSPLPARFDLLTRGRRSCAIDLKQPAGIEALLELVTHADVLIEGFRPGVTERLGFGPEICRSRNPRLVYGRMTGWGQTGPLAAAAGHDINYLALTGALHAIGRPGEAPVPPLNLVADFGGGALYLVAGVLAALVERQSSGQGQVVDAAMVDGAAHLTTMLRGMFAAGQWSDRRGENLLDGGAPFYDTYRTADGKYVAVGALEPKFFSELAQRIGLLPEERALQFQRARWPELRARLSQIFATKTRADWCAALEGSDACFAPVLSLAEAPLHPHNVARGTFVEVDGITQPAAAPRFDRTPADTCGSVPAAGGDTRAAFASWGLSADTIDGLAAAGAIR